MSSNKPVRRIAIVGTGLIGASWAAQYLASGFDVVASDPAPNAEAKLREYVDAAWPALTAIGLTPDATRTRLTFASSMKEALSDADFVQENGPERPDFKIKLFAEIDDATPPNSIHRLKFLRYHHERHSIRLQTARTLRDRPSFQSSPRDSVSGSRRGSENLARSDPADDGVLHVHR